VSRTGPAVPSPTTVSKFFMLHSLNSPVPRRNGPILRMLPYFRCLLREPGGLDWRSTPGYILEHYEKKREAECGFCSAP